MFKIVTDVVDLKSIECGQVQLASHHDVLPV